MRGRLKIFAFAVIATACFFAIASLWDDSLIVDEVPHVGTGYSYLVKQEMRLNPEHPPLAKDLAALPLMFLSLNQSVFETDPWQGLDANLNQWGFGRYFIYNSGNDADTITRLAKLPMLIFFILAAVLIFKWSHRLYGKFGAALALVLFSFSPLILAHARIVGTDMAALFGVVLASYYFLAYLRKRRAANFCFSVLALGVALLVKFSTFLLLPFFLVLAVAYAAANGQKIIKSAAPALLICITAFIAVVWPVYFAHTYNYSAERQHSDTVFRLQSYKKTVITETVVWMSDKPVLRALGHYFFGLALTNIRISSPSNPVYFLGKVSTVGRKAYFPVVYFIKEPLAWWGLVAIALAAIAITTRVKSFKLKDSSLMKQHFDEFAMLLWVGLYWTISIYSKTNIGLRHLLPVYPFTIMLVSGQIAGLVKSLKSTFVPSSGRGKVNLRPELMSRESQNYKSKVKNFFQKFYVLRFVILVLLAWYIWESLSIYPYYLTYFNQMVGGPQGGYRYVVDSNLDWGQDLKRLAQWREKNDIETIYLDYFGWADQQYYLQHDWIWTVSGRFKSAADFLRENPQGGYLVVSANYYMNSRGDADKSYAWLDAYKPITIIGNSIFVWYLEP